MQFRKRSLTGSNDRLKKQIGHPNMLEQVMEGSRQNGRLRQINLGVRHRGRKIIHRKRAAVSTGQMR